jgi:hypothetical protein
MDIGKIAIAIEIDGMPYSVMMNKLVDKNLFIEVLSTCFSDGKLSILKLSKNYKFEEVKKDPEYFKVAVKRINDATGN